MSQPLTASSVVAPDTTDAALVSELSLPQPFAVETATLGRQKNDDADKSGAMWFE